MVDERDHPVLDGSEQASAESRLRGLLAQVRADALGGSDAQLEKLLRTRLEDAGITLSGRERDRLLAELRETTATGSSAGRSDDDGSRADDAPR